MLKRQALIAIALWALVAPASAQVITNPPIAVPIGCAYNTVPPTLTNGQAGWAQCDANGSILIGGTVSATLTFPTIGAAVPATGVYTGINIGGTLTGATGGTTAADNVTAPTGALDTRSFNYVWDGAAWDRLFGDSTNGVFVNIKASVDQAPVAPAAATATKSSLIGAQATTAAVNPTNGQQAALSSDTNNNLLTSSGGAPNLSVAQVSVATSDTAVVAARALRRSVTIQQITGTQNVFCNQTTATAANGVVLPATVGSSITFNTTSAIRCIAITGAQTVAVAETF